MGSKLKMDQTSQRLAAFRLLEKAKEEGRITTHEWIHKPDRKKVVEKKGAYLRKIPVFVNKTNISFSKGNSGDDKQLQARRMKKQGKLTTKQIAEVLNVNPRTVRKWLQTS